MILFAVASPPLRAAAWSAEEGIEAFGDLVELPHGQQEALRVLADIYSEMDVQDFNQVVTFLLGVYQQEESSRRILYHLLMTTSEKLAEELNEQERDNLLRSSLSWAQNGVFLLALANMSIRLGRVGIFKRAIDKVVGTTSKVSNSRAIAIKSPFQNLKNLSKIHLSRTWQQYAAAAVGGGVLGAGIFAWNKLNRRINPQQSLFAINCLLLAEAVVFGGYLKERLASGEIDDRDKRELKRHLEVLTFLTQEESYLKSGVSVEQIREALTTIPGVSLIQEEEGIVYPQAVLYQLRSLWDRLEGHSIQR